MSTRRKLQREAKRLNPPKSLPVLVPPSAVRRRDITDCPVCGQAAAEIGGLGCCDAETANCEGVLDGEPVDDLDPDLVDERFDDVVRHYWYTDTGAPAPAEDGSSDVRCRCAAPA